MEADVVCWATLIDRLNALYPLDYKFRDVYLLTTAAEDDEETPKRAVADE